MLNKNGERELAYVVKISAVTPIEGYDRVELAHVNGWTVVVGKGEFKADDYAVYFEIDSKLPEVYPFTEMDFLVSKHYKVKTQKMCKSISQGLLVSLNEFIGKDGSKPLWLVNLALQIVHNQEVSIFLTKELGVTYAAPEDNDRKAKGVDKYKVMVQRNPALFKKPWAKWMMRRGWGRKIMYLLFGAKAKVKKWPGWVKRTDEERIQNAPWFLNDKSPWIATEKLDGSSTTFTMRRKRFNRYEFYICSRNVVFEKPNQECYYKTNIYQEMAAKYNIEEVLKDFLKKNKDVQWVTLQGETYGAGVQARTYGLAPDERDFAGFNFITSVDGRWNSSKAKDLMKMYGVPWVPIVDTNFIMPDTVKELLDIATGTSAIDGEIREGLVFRSLDGARSFKAVSNEYLFLMEYHN